MEAAIARWRTDVGGATSSAWVSQLTLAPSLRVEREGSPWYMDAGVGPSWIAPLYHNEEKRFSTQFNFRSHLALGYRLPARRAVDVSLRVEHYSNAGIKRPNPGINLVGLRTTVHF